MEYTPDNTKGESVAPDKLTEFNKAEDIRVEQFITGKQPQLDKFDSMSPFASDVETLRIASLRFQQSGKTTLAKRLTEIGEAIAKGQNHITVGTDTEGELTVAFSDLSDVPEFVQSKGELDDMKIAAEAQENMLLTGPSGSGKTLAVQYLAKILGRPLIEVQGGAGASFERLIGFHTVDERNGASIMQWNDAVVPVAMRTANAILYFDEPNSIPDDVRFYVHPVMDYRRTLTYSDGRTLKAKQGFVVIGAMNEGYAGTTILNAAFRDRSVEIPFDYLPSRKEIALLKKRGADAEFARRLVMLATQLRREAKTNKQMRTPISTRSLLQAVNLKAHGATELKAVKMAVLGKVPAQYAMEKKAISDAITAHFGTGVGELKTDTEESES